MQPFPHYHAHCHKILRVYTGGAQDIIRSQAGREDNCTIFRQRRVLPPSTPEPVPALCLLPWSYLFLSFLTRTGISQMIQNRQGAKELSFMPYARQKKKIMLKKEHLPYCTCGFPYVYLSKKTKRGNRGIGLTYITLRAPQAEVICFLYFYFSFFYYYSNFVIMTCCS